jgi:hypothetical protein
MVFADIEENRKPGIFLKTVRALKLRGKNYDYVLRTNLSSFIRLKVFVGIAKWFPRFGLYAGKRVTSRCGKKFATGSGFILSRDMVKKLVGSSRFVSGTEYADDVLVSILLKSRIVPMARLDLTKYLAPLTRSQLDRIVKTIKENGYYHIRIKNNSNREKIDLQIADHLTKRFYPQIQK